MQKQDDENEIEVGDLAIVRINSRNYRLHIEKIYDDKIITDNDVLVYNKSEGWQVSGFAKSHDISFHVPLDIATFNLGYRVMSNTIGGSEAKLVEKCQTRYPQYKGWKDSSHTFSACSFNAAMFLRKYDLFGLQEVNPRYEQVLKGIIGTKYKFISGSRILTAYNFKKLGAAVLMTPVDYRIPSKPAKDNRGMQAIWFPKFELLFINLHAPHGIDLKKEIETNCREIEIMLGKNREPKRVIMVGDFNDWRGKLSGRNINAFGLILTIPESRLVKSCCADAHYKYPGDYILVDSFDKNTEYYGRPENYDREKILMSDHDPVILYTYL